MALRVVKLLVLAVVVSGVYLGPDWGFLKGNVTVYSAECKRDVIDGVCPGNEFDFTVRAVTYRVIPEQQVVLHWVEGFPPDKLSDCAVVDRKNWKCAYADKSATFGFQAGKYFYREGSYFSAQKPLFPKRAFISRLQYLRLHYLP